MIGTWALSGDWWMEDAGAGLGGSAAERAAAFTRLLDGCADHASKAELDDYLTGLCTGC